MNRDLRNQGLLNNTITNSGATYSSDGKLGGCYAFDGVNDSLMVGNLSTMVDTDFSFACWFYKDEWGTKGYETIFGGSSGFELESKVSSTNSPVLKLYNWGGGSCTYELSKWNHVVFTRNTTETKLYLNGELKATGTAGTIPNHDYFVGSWNTASQQNFKGKMCDVRIYDHCLSEMEIKQLSQGLVLHYPLNGINNTQVPFGYQELEYIESSGSSYFNTGYRFNPEIDGCTIIMKGNDTENNGMIFADSGARYFWIYYYRAGSHINLYASNGSAQKYVSGINQDLLKHTLKYENKHFYVDGIDKGVLENSYTEDVNTIWLFSYGGSGYPFKGRIYYTDISRNGKTKKIYIPAKRLSDSAIGMYELINDEFFVSAASAFTAGPVVNTPSVIYDTSGFCNNGTVSGTLTTSNDTPKYKASTYMPKAASITHPRPVFGGVDQEWTCAMWVKLDTVNQSGIAMNNFNVRNNIVHLANGMPLLYANSGSNDYYNYGNKAVTAGVWTHVVFVFRNSDVTKLIYINGVEQTNKNGPNRTSTPSGIQDVVTVGYNLAGYISDYRVYATALSASDVLSLYQNCATIDPDGTIRGQIRS